MAEPFEDRIESLAQKLMRDGDESATSIEAARRAARRRLEDSEARTFDPAAHDHENDDVIRRTSSESAATGDSGVTRWTSDGE